MIDDITINFRSFENIASMENIRRKYNLTVDLSKFTLNKKKILSGIVLLGFNQVCYQTLNIYIYI